VYPAAAALLLHAMLVTAVLWPPRTQKRQEVAFPEPRAVQVMNLSGGKSGLLLEPQDGGSTCLPGKSYRGIGLQFDLDRVVTAAPRSYPAFQAGIRLGDIILNPDFEPNVDGYDIVNFTRLGKHRRLRVMTRWICLR
jgi:hypothetical protein